MRPTPNEVRLNDVRVPNPQPAPPTAFSRPYQFGAFLPTFAADKTISWQVGGQKVSATATSDELELVTEPSGEGVYVGGQFVVITPNLTYYERPPGPQPISEGPPFVGVFSMAP